MHATPIPMIRPPVSRGTSPSPPNPTMSRPTATTTTEISMLRIVTGTLYRMVSPGMLYPSMATKCMVQIPATPMDRAASSSQRTREAPRTARARVVHRRPRKQPRHDMA